ncbi:chemotaxis protein CheC [Geobacter sulfurreducens]|jgi:chemotaxis protein CheC|uniref:Protein phosphoaspartate phosphatase CheC associated with MCPs of class 44H n=1 Tax=Geobacter sulfurreducens (strain ATCC 51573 / DSM 12127 / PCA) TaxID=243231 RepID=Q747R5_GEOSL|nr:chemotaxis protein CheC [Geobacter sulfurreducens]BET59577.1 chemotaxis protein CheC [Geobacter sp. 60473]AAR36591.1 protein phosphoaspartate phosphatase CheC associated with MCPs of class 44H [Geobacter sulfurreducens PCA]ADI85949.1 protein phosphoaspartate phosphatase CheC associated with MCPs of class 44H [Geobacter sulfurreducens KN400]AJY69430.1 chemotaxis protein CheY [Geobacter sulfurreducens]QVW34989.1 chemotaxis protein CheC [Geobacter sulfurreducens]
MKFDALTEEHLDALKEVSNIGVAHAATALSQLIGKGITLQVPKVHLMKITEVPEAFGGAERIVVGIYLQMLGDARGNILIVLPRESALKLLSRLLPREKSEGSLLTELEISALKEVGNILASAYLNALGALMRKTLIPSVPVLSFDMAGAVIDYVLIELGEVGDLALMVETEFFGEEEKIGGQFFLLPDPESLRIILDAIGVKL